VAQSQGGQAVINKELIINPEWEHAQFVSIAELKECEQKLEAANERIKQLEDRIDRASKAFFADCPDEDALSKMLSILEEERNKP
jgi:hypothetical protein